jgi:hypothetical protein
LYRFAAPALPKHTGTTFILAITTASLWQFAWWLPTPSYNELNLCGLLLFAAGLAFAVPAVEPASSNRASEAATVATAALAAFGWCIVVFAKPTTAIAAFIGGLLWLVLLRPQRPILFVLCAAFFSSAFLLMGIWTIDGEIQRFVQRKITGLHLLDILSPIHGVSAIWHSVIDAFVGIASLRISIILGVATLWLSVLLKLEGRRAQLATLLTFAAACALAVMVGFGRAKGSPSSNTSLLAPALLLISLGLALVLNPQRPERPWRSIAMAGLLALLPACYSIGTGTPLIYSASQASIFLLAAFVVLATAVHANRSARMFTATVTTSSFVTVGMLIGATVTPYRLPSAIWNQTERVEIGPQSSPLLVDKPTADYISGLRSAASTNGFRFDTPVIDLTGGSPGAVFAMGGEAPGIPWLSGGYVGSTAYARTTLSRIPRDHLRQAWILTSPDTSGALPESLPRSLGLNFPGDYEMVAHVCQGKPCIEQFLWKPKTGALATDSR